MNLILLKTYKLITLCIYLCNTEILQKQYQEIIALNYTQLKNKLAKLLYDMQNYLQQNQIECYNRNNKVETCNVNGSCQVTLVRERGRSDSLISTCVSDRRPGSIAGLSFQSKFIGNDYEKTTISYICNKNRCNDPVIASEIHRIFSDIEPGNSKASSLKLFSIALSIFYVVFQLLD